MGWGEVRGGGGDSRRSGGRLTGNGAGAKYFPPSKDVQEGWEGAERERAVSYTGVGREEGEGCLGDEKGG